MAKIKLIIENRFREKIIKIVETKTLESESKTKTAAQLEYLNDYIKRSIPHINKEFVDLGQAKLIAGLKIKAELL